MYSAYYAPLPDKAAYLARLGLEQRQLPPTLESLHALISAHVTKIPFETFTLLAQGQAPDLTVPGLFGKIITGGRGGWCFELNGLFYVLLQELGFSVYPVGARICFRHPAGPVDHRAAVCELAGKKYFCDVGFGGALSHYAVPLDGEKSPDGAYFLREDGDFVLYRPVEGEDKAVMRFDDHPMRPEDFLPMNYYMARPEGHLMQSPICVLLTEHGQKQIRGSVFSQTGKPHRELTPEELHVMLKQEFGLYHASLRMQEKTPPVGGVFCGAKKPRFCRERRNFARQRFGACRAGVYSGRRCLHLRPPQKSFSWDTKRAKIRKNRKGETKCAIACFSTVLRQQQDLHLQSELSTQP